VIEYRDTIDVWTAEEITFSQKSFDVAMNWVQIHGIGSPFKVNERYQLINKYEALFIGAAFQLGIRVVPVQVVDTTLA
jgi:hypothetical protein